MERPERDMIEMFISITDASEAVALRKLEEHGGDLNQAVNDYFNEGERNVAQPATAVPEDDFMDVEDAVEIEPRQLPGLSLFSGSSLNPFSLLDPSHLNDLLNGSGPPDVRGKTPRVSHPREVREIPIEFKDGEGQSGPSGSKPTIEDVSSSAEPHGPETYGTVTIVDDDDDDNEVQASAARDQNRNKNSSYRDTFDRSWEPSAPHPVDDQNEIEEEMLKAAIEASRQYSDHTSLSGFDDTDNPLHRQNPTVAVDPDLARAVSLSLKTSEQEKALRELRAMNGVQETEVLDVPGEAGPSTINGRQHFSVSRESPSQIDVEAGDSSIPGESDDAEDEPFVRRRSRRLPSRYVDTSSESDQQSGPEAPSSTTEPNPIAAQDNGNDFHSDEWGGISSEEHDEAVMLEAALFGGIPEGVPYRFAYPSNQGAQVNSDSQPLPRPPSPTLTAQRLLREQQDDEYLASLLADQEKEQKAMQEAEIRLREEAAAREAAIQKEKQQGEEARRELLEQQQLERELAEKEASLPQEPASDNEYAVTLLIRMPDGSRCGRRFLKSDKLHSLFDFIDVGRVVKPGTYRLVMPYPRRAFSGAEKELSLSELGLTSKQEALFLEFL